METVTLKSGTEGLNTQNPDRGIETTEDDLAALALMLEHPESRPRD